MTPRTLKEIVALSGPRLIPVRASVVWTVVAPGAAVPERPISSYVPAPIVRFRSTAYRPFCDAPDIFAWVSPLLTTSSFVAVFSRAAWTWPCSRVKGMTRSVVVKANVPFGPGATAPSSWSEKTVPFGMSVSAIVTVVHRRDPVGPDLDADRYDRGGRHAEDEECKGETLHKGISSFVV